MLYLEVVKSKSWEFSYKEKIVSVSLILYLNEMMDGP